MGTKEARNNIAISNLIKPAKSGVRNLQVNENSGLRRKLIKLMIFNGF